MAAVELSKPSDKDKHARCKTGLGCCWCSPCYFDFPDCIGCECVQACLCWDCRNKCSPFEQSCLSTCFKSFTGVKTITSCCCVLQACAIPCDEEVPLTVGCCGWMCVEGVSAKSAVSPSEGK